MWAVLQTQRRNEHKYRMNIEILGGVKENFDGAVVIQKIVFRLNKRYDMLATIQTYDFMNQRFVSHKTMKPCLRRHHF